MSSPTVYTLVDRIDERGTGTRRRHTITRSKKSPNNNATTSIRYELPVVHTPDELQPAVDFSFTNNDYEILKNRENILFIYFDQDFQLTPNLILSLRAINNDIQIYSNTFSCLDFLRSAYEKIFFISSSADKQFLEECHNTKSIEAMFILNSDAQIDSRFSKLYGVYTHFEELLLAVKSTFEWFEQTQMELFIFERDRIFLWSQLWKEEYIKPKKMKHLSNKEKFIEIAENYYLGNTKFNQSINEFNQSYDKNDALQWCFISPFPSYFLRSTIRSHKTENLYACRFLLNDVSRIIQQQSDKKSSCELYKGMKMTNEYLDKLENHFGELICSKDYLLCSQSRKTALEMASSPDHRPDLMPVLFKITYDRSVSIAEISNKDAPSLIVFDVYTVFRVKYVNRGQISIVKIEPADEDGRKRAREYRMKYQSETVENLLEQVLSPPKPPVRLPPLQQPVVSPDVSPNEVSISIMPEQENKFDEEDDETRAQHLVERGEIDQAITIYQGLKPDSRILTLMGQLYADKKRDYDSAIIYYKKALKMQEKKGEDITNILSQLGNIHQSRREYDLALTCHSRALHKRKKKSNINQALIASNYMGMANAYWSLKNLTEALKYAEQALVINEAIGSGNEPHTAANLAILANIYHNAGDIKKALEVVTKALSLLESTSPSESPTLGTLLNNVATIQVANGLLADARHNYSRALEICKKVYPEGHATRITMENNIKRIADMEKQKESTSEA